MNATMTLSEQAITTIIAEWFGERYKHQAEQISFKITEGTAEQAPGISIEIDFMVDK